IQNKINIIINSYQSQNPSASVAGLADFYSALKKLPDGYWKTQKMKETEQLIIECSGLWFEAYSNSITTSTSQNLDWNFQAINRRDVAITLNSVALQQFDTAMNKSLSGNQIYSYKHSQH